MMKKRIPMILLSVLMILNVLPLSRIPSAAAAEDGQELVEFHFYQEDEKVFQKSVCTQYTPVQSTTAAWENGCYVADGETVIDGRVSVTGDVLLILKDGCTLTVNGGITVNEGSSLAVFAQSEGENAGKLIADASNLYDCSGIGSGWGQSCGTVIIHGARVTAKGGYYGAGIGSTQNTAGGTVMIYGGNITAEGGPEGAGIRSGKGGSVKIYGGIVNAGCSVEGTGIGGDFALYGGNVAAHGEDTGFFGTLTVYGGAFRASAGSFGTGIRGSVAAAAEVDLINLNDGSVIAPGEWKNLVESGSVFVCGARPNEPVKYLAYDTETGEYTRRECEDCRFIHNGTQTLTEGWYIVKGTLDLGGLTVTGDVRIILTDWSALCASGEFRHAGIRVKKGNSLTVFAQSDGEYMGKLIANGGHECAGIGGNEKELVGTVNIHGGNVCASGAANAAGIGGGSGFGAGTVNVYGGIVTARGGGSGAGIGGGNFGPGGKVYIFGGCVCACGGLDGAGIGGGSGGTGDTVNIYGGTVNANGTGGGAGIGGGYCGYGATVGIYGGETRANGGSTGIAIGNGQNQDDGRLGSLTLGEKLSVFHGETGEPIRKGEGQEWRDAVKIPSVFITDPTAEPEQPERTDYLEYQNGGSRNRTCEKESYVPCPGIHLWQDEWYAAEGKLTLDAVQVKGDVKLILKDGCELTVQGGINVEAGNRLTVYAQSDTDAAGKLIAYGAVYQAGIGSGLDGDCGSIVMEGGNVAAYGGACAAGIGGGSGSPYGGDIAIFGGVIFAKGQNGGAGIGSGYYDYAEYDADVMEFTDKATAGNITVCGGVITAQGSAYAAGIGGGEGSDGGNITVCAGSITAEGGEYAEAGIGDGCFMTENGPVTVLGGKVTAHPESGMLLRAMLADGSEAYGSPYLPETDITASIRSAAWIHLRAEYEQDHYIAGPVPESPQTGDAGNMTLWLALTALALAGLGACFVFGKKQSN